MGGMKQKSSSFPFYGGNLSFKRGNKYFVNLGGRKCNILVGRRKFSVGTKEHLQIGGT